MTSLLQAAPQRTLTAVPYGSPDARALARALHQEQLATYGTADDPEATEDAEFDAPNGLFLVARIGNGPTLACGGWAEQDAPTDVVCGVVVRAHGTAVAGARKSPGQPTCTAERSARGGRGF
ncbi:hypothetical protein [Streptomyces sp. NPDC048106]|uniref:hypothetical protein n=1 Tax=Streptomyces sp. NPDC048106 TaxID=3155750 RepID=UPI003451A700